MGVALQDIQNELSTFKLDDSLLFLNHLLGVTRGYTADPVLKPLIDAASPPVLPHIVHFLAKQLLLHASNFGVRNMNWGNFCHLSSMCINLDDPTQHDPNWKHADPSGFLERLFHQQIGPQQRNPVQKFGLALGLFRDAGPIDWPKPYNLRAELESELQVTLDQFMGMGFITFALRAAKHQGNECMGTFTPMTLARAYDCGYEFCVPEIWSPYLDRVSATRADFQEALATPHFQVESEFFEQFGFNPLRRSPIIKLDAKRYLAIDPELVIERVTLGLFYDLFDRNGTHFSERFGYAFEAFVGQLLSAVCPVDRLWSAAEWEKSDGRLNRQSQKFGDWAYIGDSCTVLLECKSMRPSLELTTLGSDHSVVALRERVSSAVQQLMGHSQGISDGKWEQFGLPKAPTVGVVVTYGKFFTINGPFARKKIRDALSDTGQDTIPFVVLSLDELDTALWLVEKGYPFDALIQSLVENEDSFNPLHKYHNRLRERAVSSFTYNKGKEFMDHLVHSTNRSSKKPV